MSSPAGIQRFYSTDLAPCPYLAGRQERRLVALAAAADEARASRPADRDRLPPLAELPLQAGLPELPACMPVRIVADGSDPSRSFRRILRAQRRSRRPSSCRPAPRDEQFALFHRYLLSRHDDGGMIRMDREAYRDMVEVAPATTRLVEFRDPTAA